MMGEAERALTPIDLRLLVDVLVSELGAAGSFPEL
jgi:hypothetical protein